MKTITMLELRRNAAAVVADLRRGVAMTLTYRGQPLARLEPICPAAEEIRADDPFYTLADHASLAESAELRAGNATMSNADIDRTLYGG